MSSFLLYILKSTIGISLLYGGFRLFMRKETFFALNRAILLAIVLVATAIPMISLPTVFQSIVLESKTSTVQQLEIYPIALPDFAQPENATIEPISTQSSLAESHFSWATLIQYLYWAGILITFLILIHGIGSVLVLFKNATTKRINGYKVVIVDHEVSPFSFAKIIVISRADYENHRQSILTHEQAHIQLNHFFDLALLEAVKIFHWFNPFIYLLIKDMKEIHEFQADENTLNSGIDAKQYQFLIIQKSVGKQRFALANSFNHCQIKNRITMMNKSKTSKARRWKVATFLPLLALLLMAFSKPGELKSDKRTSKNEVVPPSTPAQSKQSQTDRVIEIKSDGNYIGSKLFSLDEIEKTVRDWANASNKWIQIQAEKTTPNYRIDEILEKLGGNTTQYHIIILLDDSEIIYPAGDVSSMAKFRENWNKWLRDQLSQYSEGKSDQLDFSIKYRFIIDNAGKVTGARIVKTSQSAEINTAMEKILSQIPGWTPAKIGNETVSVLYDESWMNKASRKN